MPVRRFTSSSRMRRIVPVLISVAWVTFLGSTCNRMSFADRIGTGVPIVTSVVTAVI